MKARAFLDALFALTVLGMGPARADWDPSMVTHMHYPQLPQIDPQVGMDILDTVPMTLGDDFLVTKRYPLTDIHVWCSWLNDVIPAWGSPHPDPRLDNVTFKISIWSDVPAGVSENFSHPGQLIWQKDFLPGQYKWRLWSTTSAPEKFYDPGTSTVQGSDFIIWEYNFYIPKEQACSLAPNVIYWLVITADVRDIYQKAKFGWKTTASNHFQDAAVCMPATGGWQPLAYPSWHPKASQPMDLAFVVTQRLPGDINGDDCVDVVDLLDFVAAFGSVAGDATYDPACDLNLDGSIDVIDLLTFVDSFGTCDP